MRQHFLRASRVIGFSVIPMFGLLSPLLALPSVTTKFGATGWAAIAIGQSLGTAAAVLVELGWSLSGPQRIAPQSQSAARRILALSMVTKSIVCVPAVLVAATCAAALTPEHVNAAALTATASTLTGLSSVWYYLGKGKILKIFLFDALPKVGFVGLSALLILQGKPLWAYPCVGLIAPILLSTTAVCISEHISPKVLRGITLKRTLLIIAAQRSALAARAASALYISLPVAIIGTVSPSAVPLFAAVERLQRMTLQVLAAIPNMMQKWVGISASKKEREARIKKAILFNGIFGIIAGAAYSVAVPRLANIVFSGVVNVPAPIALMSGLLIFIVCMSRGTGNLGLVALRKVPMITRSAVCGAIVGVVCLVLLGYYGGATGALAAEVIAESVVLLIQISALRHLYVNTKGAKSFLPKNISTKGQSQLTDKSTTKFPSA